MKHRLSWLGLLLLLVIPRIAYLKADAYPPLSWESGIWTDEGFYTYNARNAALFGHKELDQFNNHLLSPLLSEMQQVVFSYFGVGLVPARMISVLASLLVLVFFYDALRRLYGRRTALTGLLLLGLEPTFLFYNRLALMETPGLVVVCGALWCWSLRRPWAWVLAGALAASAIAWKTTLLLFLPIPAVVALWEKRGRSLLPYIAGAVLGFAVYAILWGIPHGGEIRRMNDYYRVRQAQPVSVWQSILMVRRAWLENTGGMLQWLVSRTPVLTALALLALFRGPARCGHGKKTDADRLFWLWLAGGIAILSFSRYAPSRYFLIFYPALAAVAARMVWRVRGLLRLAPSHAGARRIVAMTTIVIAYHLLTLVGVALGWLPRTTFGRLSSPFASFFPLGVAVLIAALVLKGIGPTTRLTRLPVLISLAMVSLGHLSYATATRDYQTTLLAQYLELTLGSDAILVADWAPNLCLENKLRAIPVFDGLANDHDPVRTLHADYVLVGQTPYPKKLWRKWCPTLQQPVNFISMLNLHGYKIALYRVPVEAKS